MQQKRRKHVPLRTCVACHQKRPKRELIRVVRTLAPEGTIEIDLKGKLPGRGTYLCREQSCWDKGLDPRKLGRALKCSVSDEEIRRLREGLALLPAVEKGTE